MCEALRYRSTDRAAPLETGRGRRPDRRGGYGDDDCARRILAGVSRLQHDQQPVDPEEQVQCFGNAAAHLRPGGYFVIELNVPKLRSMPLGEDVYPFDVTPEHLGFERYDFMNQRSVSHHYWFNGNQNSRFDSHHRYVWPSELDLMAMLAGMTLQQRWQDWDRTPFTGESQKHVSVWQLPA